MDCSLPSSSVHGISQKRTLEWAAIPFSKGSSWPRDRTPVSGTAGTFFTSWATREAQKLWCPFKAVPAEEHLGGLRIYHGCQGDAASLLNTPHGNHPLAFPHWDGGKWLLLNTKASCNNVQWVPSLFLYIIMLSSLVIPSTLIPNQHGFDPLSNFNCCLSSLLSLSFKLKSYPNFSLYILTSQPLFSILFCVSYPQKNRCNACVMDEACNETNIYDFASKYKVIILWPQGCFPFQNILKEAE